MVTPASIIIFVSGTSVRKVDVEALAGLAAASGSAAPAVPASSARTEQIAQLRARMAQIGGEVPDQLGGPHAGHVTGTDVLQIGTQFENILPGGGLPRQAVTHMSDTPALVVEMLLQITEVGRYVGVVGWPELSYAALPPECLNRVIAVPDPGVDPLGITGVLVEGLDLVVFRTRARVELSPVRARPLLGKLRKGRAVLMLVGATVPSPALTVTGDVQEFRGIGRGTGRITGLDIRVRAQPKSAHPASGTVTVGQARETVAAPAAPALKVVT